MSGEFRCSLYRSFATVAVVTKRKKPPDKETLTDFSLFLAEREKKASGFLLRPTPFPLFSEEGVLALLATRFLTSFKTSPQLTKQNALRLLPKGVSKIVGDPADNERHKTMNILSQGDTPHKQQDFVLPATIGKQERRPTLLSYAGALRARGKDFEDIHAELLRVNRERCDPPLSSTRELNDLQRIAKWVASKPAGRLKSGVWQDGHQERLEQAFLSHASHQWRGTFARTCQLVSEYMLGLMQCTQKITVDVSTRDAAEIVGYSRATVARALRVLSGRYRRHTTQIPVFFTYQRPARRGDAPTFSLSKKIPILTHTVLPHTPSVLVCLKKRSFVHDAFRGKKGLSKTCLLVLNVIEETPNRTAKEVAMRAGACVRTVEKCLTQLKAEGLIEKRRLLPDWAGSR